MKKLIAINCAVFAVLIALSLGALEIWLRATVPSSSGGTIYAYTLDTKRYKLMKAGAAVTAWGKELRTNDLGFRDRESSIPPKQPGEFRIVVLGDSFTVSAGVDFADIYTSRLEARLRRQYPGARVINLAVGGYNVVQYALTLQEVGLALEPDMVVVGLFPDNDFNNDTYDANWLVASGKAMPEPEGAWYEQLYVYRAYGWRIENKLKGFLPQAQSPLERKTGGWEQNTAALKAIAAMSAQRNLPLEVAMLPHTWNFDKQRALFARVEKECRSSGIACRNLLEPFIASGVNEATLRLNPLDAHPNERYNALVAEFLASDLERFLPVRKARGA